MSVLFRRTAFLVGLGCAAVVACSSGGPGQLATSLLDASYDFDATADGPSNRADGSLLDASRADGTTGLDATLGDGAANDGASSDAGPDVTSSCVDAGPYPDAAAGASAFTIDSVSYGSGGSRVLNFTGPGSTYGAGMARQSDGKLLLGIQVGWNSYTVGVARFLATGAIDAAFGTNGVAFVPLGKDAKLAAVLLQSTGKIVLVGTSDFFTNTTKSWIVRLDATGALDATFGTGGVLTVDGASIGAAALQSDDAILAAGYVSALSKHTVIRFQSNGTLDGTFGSGGYAATNGLNSNGDLLFQQGDGKILVGTNYPRRMSRLTAAGALDTGFGTGGAIIETQNDAGEANSIYAFAQQGDGLLLAAGRDLGAFGVQRLAQSGAPDSTFGADGGWATLPSDAGPINGHVGAASVQADGKILAAGSGGGFTYGVARFNTDGGIDTTYGTNGFANAPFNAFGQLTAMVPAAGNTAVGGDQLNYTTNIWVGTLSMLNASGAVVTSFGDAGLATLAAGASHDEALGIALQSDGKAVVVGAMAPDRSYDIGGVARFTTTGALDTSFAGTGKATMPGMRDPASVVIESSGRIVVGGPVVSNSSLDQNTFVMQGFTSAGANDPTFGTDGGVSAPKFPAKTIALGPSDRIAAVGEMPQQFSSSSGVGFVVSSFGANGRPSAGWGDAGPDAAVVPVSTPASAFGMTSAGASAAAVQSDGRIVAVGYAGVRLALARYETTGILDPSFGVGGLVTTDADAQAWVSGSFRVVVQSDSAILVAGVRARYASGNQLSDLVLARYDAAGQLDCTFGSGGIATVALGPIESYAISQPLPVGLALGSDGRIFVTTTTSADGVHEKVLLLRFTTAGFVDARSELQFGPGLDVGHAVAVQNDGKVVIAGRSWTQAGLEDFFVARFIPPP